MSEIARTPLRGGGVIINNPVVLGTVISHLIRARIKVRIIIFLKIARINPLLELEWELRIFQKLLELDANELKIMLFPRIYSN